MSIEQGTEAMLMRRAKILDAGAKPVGWKVGFNVPEIQQKLGIDAPLAGFLTTDSLIEGSWDEYQAGTADGVRHGDAHLVHSVPYAQIKYAHELMRGRGARFGLATSGSAVRPESVTV